jgi:hypothetical protein
MGLRNDHKYDLLGEGGRFQPSHFLIVNNDPRIESVYSLIHPPTDATFSHDALY